MLVGQAVAMDLSALALRLSERAPLQPSDLPGGAVTLVHGADDLENTQLIEIAMTELLDKLDAEVALLGQPPE